jgi:hypothetical protein
MSEIGTNDQEHSSALALQKYFESLDPVMQLDALIEQIKIPLESFGLPTDKPIRLISQKMSPETEAYYRARGWQGINHNLGDDKNWPAEIILAARILFRATEVKGYLEKKDCQAMAFNLLILMKAVDAYKLLGVEPWIKRGYRHQEASEAGGKASGLNRSEQAKQTTDKVLQVFEELVLDGHLRQTIAQKIAKRLGITAGHVRKILKASNKTKP